MTHHLFVKMAAACCLLTCCQSVERTTTGTHSTRLTFLEPQAPSSFLENCRQLKQSNGFRQNIWLCGKTEASAAICMDLDRRLYLVVRSERPARTASLIDEPYKQLMVTPETLQSRMHSDSFILNGGAEGENLVGIFTIPENADESFGINLINHVLNLDLNADDLSFQWD